MFKYEKNKHYNGDINSYFLLISSYIVYDKVLNTKNENSFNDEENTVLPEWVNYLNQYDLTLTRGVWYNDKDECNFEKATINSNDIKKIMVDLSTKK